MNRFGGVQVREHDVVVVGAAQLKQRPEDPTEAREPLALMEDVVRGAAADAGCPEILQSIEAIAVVRGAWSYADPGRLIAEQIGAPAAHTILTTMGGNHPQTLINDLGSKIVAGELDVAIVVGAEAIHSRRRLRAAGLPFPATEQGDGAPDETHGSDASMSSDAEHRRGVDDPTVVYPLFENALRYLRGESIREHRDRLSRLWARFNEVAVANPYAWVRTPMTAEEIRDPSPDNRMIGFPYTKAMNSNWYLDQAAAVLLCSVRAARAAGIARDRWVFAHAGVQANDTQFVSNRRDLHSSPAIGIAGRRLLDLTGIDIDDVTHLDLYSCFPSAVQVAARELGLAEDRQLTLTGGLTFAGGPYSNYVTHALATLVGVLRDDPATLGLVTANGGFLTKHAIGLYSTEPARGPFRAENVQADVDRLVERPTVESHQGPVAIESSTVVFGREGPERGVVACLLPDGARAWGWTTDLPTMELMMTEEVAGTTAKLERSGAVQL